MNNAGKIEFPFLIQQGTADTLIDPTITKQFVDKAKSKDKTLKEYSGAKHNIYQESCAGILI